MRSLFPLPTCAVYLIIAFHSGADGSREIDANSIQVDTTGTGTSFASGAGLVTLTANGDPAPAAVGSDTVTGTLGAACAGGADGKSCLVSFTTTAGFGNCVLMSQAGGAAAAGAAAANTTAADAAAATATGGKKGKGKKGDKKANAAAAVRARRISRLFVHVLIAET